jgi:hypothetical protein
MTRRTALQMLIGLAGALAGSIVAGCYGIPKGTLKEAPMGSMKIEAEGAGLVTGAGDKTTFLIRGGRCGYTDEPTTIDTPKFAQPYVRRYTCPKCGHQQWVTVQQLPK